MLLFQTLTYITVNDTYCFTNRGMITVHSLNTSHIHITVLPLSYFYLYYSKDVKSLKNYTEYLKFKCHIHEVRHSRYLHNYSISCHTSYFKAFGTIRLFFKD